MNKILSLFISVTLVLSLVPPAAFATNDVTSPVHIDFSDYDASSKSYKTYVGLGDKYEVESDGTHGKYIRVYHKDYASNGKAPYINFNSKITSDGVFGFSYKVSDTTSRAYLASKGNSSTYDVKKIFEIKGKKLYAIGNSSEPVYTPNTEEWVDVALGFDYEADSSACIHIYVNGKFVKTYYPGIAVPDTKNFSISMDLSKTNDAQTGPASICFDDFFVYYPPLGPTADIGNSDVDSSLKEINIKFGEKVVGDNFTSCAKINGLNVESEAVYEHGYVTGVKLKNLSMEPKTNYTVSFLGIKNLLNKDVESFNFKTASKDPVINIDYNAPSDKTKIFYQDTKLRFKVNAVNITDSPLYIYQNGELVQTVASDAAYADIILKGGTNTIYLQAGGNEVCKSNEITFNAIKCDLIGIKTFIDFSDGSTAPLHSFNEFEGKIEVKKSDNAHGNSLYLEFDGSSIANSDLPVARVGNSGKKGIYVYEADYAYSTISADNFPFLSCKVKNSGGDEVFNSIYKFANGTIKGNGNEIYSGIEASSKNNLKWYSFKATYNMETGKSDFYVNGFLVAENIALTNPDFTSVLYISNYVPAIQNTTTWMYLDNISSYFMAPSANAVLCAGDGSAENAPYENCPITLGFDRKIDISTLSSLKITDTAGTETDLCFVSSDGFTFTATASKLKPNTIYTAVLDNVRTIYGACVNNQEVSFKTRKLPFCIDSVTKTVTSSNIKLNVKIKNENNEQKSYVILAGLFDGSELIEAKSIFDETSLDMSYDLTFSKPDGSPSAEIYLFDSIKNLNITDKFIID